MLSGEENALLTSVGPATPMGHVMRQYWLPMLLSSELAPGDRGKRVKLLGEDLVAFRSRQGQVELLGEFCSHRHASLYFGRNGEGGLRCVYHGWQFRLDGQRVDMPNEPPETNFHWCISWHGTRALTAEERAAMRVGLSIHILEYAPATTEAYGGIRPRADRHNEYLIDWQAVALFGLSILGVCHQRAVVIGVEGRQGLRGRTHRQGGEPPTGAPATALGAGCSPAGSVQA